MIQVEKFVKRFGRIEAVKELSFEVRPGEVLGLLGPNGAGKTTTIRAMVGLTRPSSGHVRVAGFDVWTEPVKAKASFGYIPDRPYLYGKLSARELLRFVAGLYKTEKSLEKIERWLEFFSLTDFGNEFIETFSHGMKQKLAIIAALLPEPPVLIVDEPMVGLDPRAAKQVRELFKDYAAEGRTVLLTTHSLPVAEATAHRIIVMDKGRVLGMGTLEELRKLAGTERGDVQGESLEKIFFKLILDEQNNAQETQ